MRLRLFERLRRIASWRSRDQARGGMRDSGPREDAGRHRRIPGTSPSRAQRTTQARMNGAGPMQPPAGLPLRTARRAQQAQQGQPAQPPAGLASHPPDAWMGGPAGPPAPRDYAPRTRADRGGGGGIGRARIREAPFGAAPTETVTIDREAHRQAPATAAPRQPWYQVVGEPAASQQAPSQAIGVAEAATPARPAAAAAATRTPLGARSAALPFAAPHPKGHPPTADGRRNCGALEAVLWRQWDAAATAPPEVIAAIERLAEFPRQLQEKLAAGLDGIYVGAGGVPELDDMAGLRGVPLPSGRATWDACAGAYGERKIVVGSRPSPTPDVMCHEVGHALDDLDSPPGKWQSDSAEFRMIYDQCQPYIASDFHRQRGGLGRKEFFADAFAAIASAQRPALVDMLSGNTRIALRVMLYFNRRYGI